MLRRCLTPLRLQHAIAMGETRRGRRARRARKVCRRLDLWPWARSGMEETWKGEETSC
jgi:hypothetical protein